METIWVQALLGLLATTAPFVGAALGAALLACTPLRGSSGRSTGELKPGTVRGR